VSAFDALNNRRPRRSAALALAVRIGLCFCVQPKLSPSSASHFSKTAT